MYTATKSSNGFTLIELLVVISVLGVLSSIVIVAINPAERLRQARDTHKVSFMRQVKDAVTGYYADAQGKYPGCKPDLCNYSWSGGYYYGPINGNDPFSVRLVERKFLKNIPPYPDPPSDQSRYGECNQTLFSAANDSGYKGSYYMRMCLESWDIDDYNRIQYQNFVYCGRDCNRYASCGDCRYYCYRNPTYYKYIYCLVGYYKYETIPNSYGDFEVPEI